MLRLAFKKIINNKVLMLSLFSGILIAVLIACTIPIYSSGISHRMLVTQLETYQKENNVSPGVIVISGSLSSFGQRILDEDGNEIALEKNDSRAIVADVEYATNYLENEIFPQMNMPAFLTSMTLSTGVLTMGDDRDTKKTSETSMTVRAAKSYENAVTVTKGRMPKATPEGDEILEVMISEAAAVKHHLAIGTVLQAGNTVADILNANHKCDLMVKVVGIFQYVDDPLNPIAENDTGDEMYADYEAFYNEVLVKKNMATKGTWYFAGDYTKFELAGIEKTIAMLKKLSLNVNMWGLANSAGMVIPPVEQYETYFDNVNSVNVLLALFYAPIMILIVFFIFMISKFVVENDKNEIAMLNSRGASRMQIDKLYLIQGGALALIAVVIAPFLALALCKLLGTTSGFMEFSQWAPLKVLLSFSAVMCGIGAAALAIVTMLVPVHKAGKVEIVQQKRSKLAQSPVFVSLIMLAAAILLAVIAAYAYYVLVIQQEGLITAKGSVQPLAYLFLVCFFAAFGLFFVLLYPYLLRLIIRISGRKWNAAKYSAFSRIAEMRVREKFIVVFLTLTIAIGVFSSVSARTLNRNMDTSTRYENPCDKIVDLQYYAISSTDLVKRTYFFDKLPDTDAMPVVQGNNPRINSAYSTSVRENVRLMGIDPAAFNRIVTWDDTILDEPMVYYLQLLVDNPKGCIISANTAEMLGVTVGDFVSVRPDSNLPNHCVISGQVLAIVDAWPTYYPEVTEGGFTKTTKPCYLVVCNKAAVDGVAPNEPYQVWMNTTQSVSAMKKLATKYFARIKNVQDGARAVYLSEINALRQATNGALTLGFIAVLIVCTIGFAIYWILSIKSRTLQIGTMRALGMSVSNVYNMIIWEQVLLCVASILLGIVAGILSGVMFAPLLQSAFETMGQMPPYRVGINFMDFLKLLAFIVLLIGAGLMVALTMLKRINAAAAIKLGEE